MDDKRVRRFTLGIVMTHKTNYLKQATLITMILSVISFPLISSASNRVAKVIILRGKVKKKESNKIVDLKKGMWLEEGAIVQTAPRSFCKLLFIDKSQMSLGPKSKMEIKAFPKDKPGIINLLNGQLRSKVTKNYMSMDKKSRSKLFIKTKTAAMGVRGTDFQVNFNRENMVTSLVTFEGAVAMAKFDDSINQINQRALERIVSSKDAVIVTKGQYSGVDNAAPRVTPPTKINPTQLETLKNTTGNVKQLSGEGKTVSAPKKQFRNKLPPGVSAKTFANSGKSLEKNISAVVGKAVVVQVKQEVAKADHQDPKWAAVRLTQPKDLIAPKAGGYVDLKTALYIPPPAGSTFDANIGVFVPPAKIGTIDSATGAYIPPAGLILTAAGKFEQAPIDMSGRAPASISPTAAPPVPQVVVALPSELDTVTPIASDDITSLDPQTTTPTEEVSTADQDLIDNAVLDSTWDYENAPPPIEAEGFTQVHINIQ